MKDDLIKKMMKTGFVDKDLVASLDKSEFFASKNVYQTDIPALNLALSGKLNGGLTPGLTVVAGPSRTFKSNMCLKMVKGYLDHDPDAICIFYDSEFGITPEYLQQMGVDTSRMLHIPIKNIEEFKFDVVQKLEELKKGDKVVFFVDSVGNLASKKEVDDAKDEKSVADMTRAKQLKSCFRMITPYLTTKNIPMIVINHVYQETGMFPKTIMSGGTGILYSSNTAFIISRSQEKTGKDLTGYTFTINIEKSRFLKEKSRIPITVSFDEGIKKTSGLFELALSTGFFENPSSGWYTLKGSDAKFRKADADKYLLELLENQEFIKFVEKIYAFGTQTLTEEESEALEKINEITSDE